VGLECRRHQFGVGSLLQQWICWCCISGV
jgi:hypothetical protein